jgi:acetyl esterase
MRGVRERLMKTAVRTALKRDRVARFIGRKRATGPDAALDRQVAAVLELERMMRYPALDSMTPQRARRYAEAGLSPLELDPVDMAGVVDTTVDGPAGPIAMRVYTPANASENWLVYFHGGGGVIGSIRDKDPVARYLAAATRCTVASIDYRLGPEAKHPAAIDDAVAAWRGVVARVKPGARVVVAGDSFGGYLSAHVDRRAERKPDLAVLIYPMVDLTLSAASIDRFARGYLLTRSMMHWFRGHYLHDDDDQRANSPRYWDDGDLLRRACPTIIATAGFDPLVDEGIEWADRLRAAGVTVRHRHYPSLVHGFLSLAGVVRAARAAVDELCRDVAELLR